MGVPGVASSADSWADSPDKGKGKDTAAADPWAAGAQKLAAFDLPAHQRKMADLSADPISNWRTMKHIMKTAARKARGTITSVSASEILPFESRNEDPQVIAEARALTLRSIARAVWYQDLALAQRLREVTIAGAQHIDISRHKISLVCRIAFETEHSAMQLQPHLANSTASIFWPVVKTLSGAWTASHRMHVDPHKKNCLFGSDKDSQAKNTDDISHYISRPRMWALLAQPRGHPAGDVLTRLGLNKSSNIDDHPKHTITRIAVAFRTYNILRVRSELSLPAIIDELKCHKEVVAAARRVLRLPRCLEGWLPLAAGLGGASGTAAARKVRANIGINSMSALISLTVPAVLPWSPAWPHGVDAPAAGSGRVLLLARAVARALITCVQAANDRDVDKYIRSHKHGRQCVKAAEEVETKVGFFDDKKMSSKQQKAVAAALVSRVQSITGQRCDWVQEKLYNKMVGNSGPFGSEGMGATDACAYVLQQVDEVCSSDPEKCSGGRKTEL
ncbi:unnamed protein product [Prorocentrum cordatum]|uniref:Uncharacterized protein n=1 Tax=Prorocentrum cordatum TaxID=2364126 RepID=A0ABN9SYQ4_9DINO|nr:unnamed protein product [Polarella glacialis]